MAIFQFLGIIELGYIGIRSKGNNMMSLEEEVQTEVALKPSQKKKETMPRIMVVDDDLELLEEIKEILSFHNYDVEIMSNSALAFEKACEIKPDLIITDLKMIPKSGFQLADELHNSFKTKGIPIIAITGFFTEKEHLLMMKMFGMKYAILKPFNPADLIAKVDSVLKEAKNSPPQTEKTV